MPIREFQSTTATSAVWLLVRCIFMILKVSLCAVQLFLPGACQSATGATSARNIHKYCSFVFGATFRSNPLHMYWFMGSADCAKCGRCGSAAAGTLPAQACGNDYDEDGHGSHVAGVPVATSLMDLSTRLLFPPRNYRRLHKLGRRFVAQCFSKQRRSGRLYGGRYSSWRAALLPGAT